MDDEQRKRIVHPAAVGKRWAPVVVLVLIAVLVYANSFDGRWVLDDEVAVTANPDIRHFFPLGSLLFPDAHSPLVGRPLASLTFALNYAFGGTQIGGYHGVNLVLHICAGLAVFGLVRRTLSRLGGAWNGTNRALPGAFDSEANVFAFVVAGWWTAHPLLTGTVTYVSQRTEGMMALLYLLTLYAFVRGAEARASSARWLGLSVVCCALGVATKEVMVTAPVLVLLYDRCFVTGTWREAWRQRRGYYIALFVNWILLALLMQTGVGQRGVGFGRDVTWLTNTQTECQAVLRYVWLTLWPRELVFDYGPVYLTAGEAAPFALVLVALLAAAAYTLWRWPRVGFVAVSFFVLLAPTSSVVPVLSQPIAENRAYLPSLAVLTLFALALRASIGWRGLLMAGAAITVAGGIAAHRRNETYRSAEALWLDATRKWPRNPRAHSNLGQEYFNAGDYVRAAACFERALAVDPRWLTALINLGSVFGRRGELDRAIALQERAVAIHPGYAPAYLELGNSLYGAGRKVEAVRSFEAALGIRPNDAEAHRNLAVGLADLNRGAESVAHFERAVQLRPDFVEGYYAFGATLARLGRTAEAIRLYERVLQLQPSHTMARHNYAVALGESGRVGEAIVQEREALRLDPTFALAHANLAALLIQQGQLTEALSHAEAAMRSDPVLPLGYTVRGRALLGLGRMPEAIEVFAAAVQRWPGSPDARSQLGVAFYQGRRFAEAVAEFERAHGLQPGNADLLKNLASGLSQVGREAEAIDRFRASLQLNDNDPDTHRNLALVLEKMGRVEEAAMELDAALRLRPADPLALEQRARLRSSRDAALAK